MGGGNKTLLYAGYRIASLLSRLLPIGSAYRLAEVFADCWYALNRQARENVKHNVGQIPGIGTDDRTTGRLARRIMRNFARMVTEFFYMQRTDSRGLTEMVDIESFTRLKRLVGDRPAIFITAHLGNWELGAAAAASIGIDLQVVVYDHPDPRVAALFRGHRRSGGLKIMSVKEAARRMRTALKRGPLGIVADRDYTGKGTEVSFLGTTITVPAAYAALAIAEKVPIIPGFCLRQPDGRYHLLVEEPVFSPGDASSDATTIVADFIRLVEKQVEKYPEQWYLFQKVGG
jgi:KDO2-lipid IV(A) lauroyltransferase